ncbi:alpha/beta hydrolase [Fodinicola acaciae]|uniref:alpha/beta hydrolase n=1 Tax=Fodinicola acaciae TaxID=2681555 RepID=UPI0013D01647|nr:alpha/beta fold hydrolase [Fodinicola acaciae]
MRTRWKISALVATALVATGGPVAAAPPAQGLTGQHPCPGMTGYTCSTLTVPLDHRSPRGRTLDLQVAAADNVKAPKGTLILLTGGPGQPGVSLLPRLAPKLQPILGDYRLVMFDQRGTGANALNCPRLQAEMGSTDLAMPTRKAVEDCAGIIGPDRRFYTTSDTVADLDQLRKALGANKVVLDGVSYGTYTAEHYAIAHPHNVAKLILDSVVPHDGDEPLWTTPMKATGRVLRAICQTRTCPSDPVADLAAVVRARTDGSDILNALTVWGIVDPTYAGAPEAIHQARTGNSSTLDGWIQGVKQATPPEELSQGLHASTLCGDLRWPWITAHAPLPVRQLTVNAAAARLPESAVYPYDRRTAATNGVLLTCLYWPESPVPQRNGRMPDVPTLLLGGDRDLSTPYEWLYAEAKTIAHPRIVIVPGAGHSVMSRATSPAGRDAIYQFLSQ